MGYTKDFKVNITRLTSAVAQKGFGTILVLSTDKDHVVKSYSDIASVETDFISTTETYKMASALFGQGVDEIKIAGKLSGTNVTLVTELNKIVKTDDNFFGLVCTDTTSTVITALSEWINTQEKVYAVTSSSKTISGTSDKTLLGYHATDKIAEKSLAYMLTKEIGAVDLDGKKVPNISNSEVTITEYNVLKGNNVNVCVEKFGNLVIDGGNTAGGEKFDVILGEAWIKAKMEEDSAILKINNPKIPYTDEGIALLVGVANTRLKLATEQGIIAFNADGVAEYEVTYKALEDVPQADRANRRYDYVKWTARLAGAIREGIISGELTV